MINLLIIQNSKITPKKCFIIFMDMTKYFNECVEVDRLQHTFLPRTLSLLAARSTMAFKPSVRASKSIVYTKF